MSFWRKLNKIVFTISLVAMCLAVLGGSFWILSRRVWLGLVFLVGGAILIPVLFSTWGILLEFLDNVAAIRRAVCSNNFGAPVQAAQADSAGQTSGAVKTNEANYELDNGKWVCGDCGKNNGKDAAFCVNCGKPKN